MIEWVTGPAILAQAGVPAPSSDDAAWADACAGAVNAGLAARLDGTLWAVVDPPGVPDAPELSWAALTAGVEAYKRREAVFGITGYVDMQGAAVRVARDYLEAVAPIVERYATRGIA